MSNTRASTGQELAESEESSAAVSRGLFLAYVRSTHGGGGGGGAVSLQRWLEDRQAAMKKVQSYLRDGKAYGGRQL